MGGIPASILPLETSLNQGVWVVIPSRGTQRTEFTLAVLNMSPPINTNCGVYMPIGMQVDEVRNVFAQAAIDHNVKYIMFVDDDVLVAPHTLRRLYYWMEQFEDLDIVGGVYCAKDAADPDAKPFPLVFRGDGAGPYWDWRYGEFFECLPPNQLVQTAEGWKKIIEVTQADAVRSHTGKFRAVTGTTCRQYSGHMVHIRGVNTDLELTPEHPVYVVRIGLNPAGRLKRHKFNGYKPHPVGGAEWVRAGDLKPGDVMLYPVPDDVIPPGTIRLRDSLQTSVVSLHGKLVRPHPKRSLDTVEKWLGSPARGVPIAVPDSISVTPSLLRLLGYYIAEGHTSIGLSSRGTRGSDALVFSFGQKDNTAGYVDDCVRLLKEVFGVRAKKTSVSQGSLNVIVYSSILAEWFRIQFGHRAPNKRVPGWLMVLPTQEQLHFLRGAVRGDGHIWFDGVSCGLKYTTASHQLVWQMRDLFLRQGWVPTVQTWERPFSGGGRATRTWDVNLNGCYARQAVQTLESEEFLAHRVGSRGGNSAWIQEGYAWYPVRSVERRPYEGSVYNLHVAVDESYIAQGVAVHNCTGMGMGCTMLRVETLKKMKPPWFLTQRYSENVRNEKSGEVLGRHNFIGSEDLYFYRRVREELGGKIWCDGSLVFEHIDEKGRRFGLPPDCKILRPTTFNGKPFGHQGKIVLNLGCGKMYDIFEEGEAIRVDLREEANPDYRADLRNLPFEDEYADCVFSSHTLEHFGRWEQEAVLKEWIRVLKPGGVLRLVVPNLLWAAKKIVAHGGLVGDPDSKDVLSVLYGEQDYPLNFHQFGFTRDLLRSLVMTYGIDEPMFSETSYSLVMEARKKGSWADPVQESMRGKLKTWVRSPAGQIVTPEGGAAPSAAEEPATQPEPTVDKIIRGWVLADTPKAFSVFWDPNREAEVSLALLTRRVGEAEREKLTKAPAATQVQIG